MYLWFKAFHLIAVITWFAGLFYLPRLFVYHAEPGLDSRSDERFCKMESRLFTLIMMPSLVLTLFFGLGLIHTLGAVPPWLLLKLGGVLLLWGYQYHCWQYLQAFKRKENRHTARYYRFFNEVPSLLLVIIVLLAVLKPF